MNAWNTVMFSLLLHGEIIFLMFPASNANSCNDTNWEYFNGSCYSFRPQGTHENNMTWFEARRTCQSYGGDLASVISEEELNFLKDLKSILGLRSLTWIGLSKVEQTNLTWSDGSKFKFGYEQFYANETINELYACICTSNMFDYWYHNHCASQLGFLCKKSIFESKPGSNISIDSVCPKGFFSDSVNRKCYHIGGLSHDGKVNESEARRMCQSMVSTAPVNLASIHSQADQDLINLIMENISSDIWIGIHNRYSFHIYMWEDYSEMTFQNWNIPNIFTNRDAFNKNLTKCGKIERYPRRHGDEGKWTKSPCDEKHAYLCQTIKSTFEGGDNNSQSNEWLLVNTFNGKFVVTNESMTWQQARLSCMETKRDLAFILDMFEMSKVNFVIRTTKIKTPVWIGMKFNKKETQYLWAENVPVNKSFWSPGKPSSGEAERCVILKENNWFEKDCTELFPFVCQSRSNEISHKNIKDTYRKVECPEKSMRPFGDSCFHIHVHDHVTWLEAHNRCRLTGKQLASVTSKLEHDFLLSEVKAINEPEELNDRRHVWIGMYRDVDGRLFWSDDSPVQYVGETEFDPTFEDFKNLNTFCFSLDVTSGHWRLQRCENSQNSFICKSKILQATAEEPNVITLTLVVTGVCITVLSVFLLGITFFAKKLKRAKIVKTDQAKDESSNTSQDIRNASSGDYTTIEDVSEMTNGLAILNDDAYNKINDSDIIDDTEYITPVEPDTQPSLPDRSMNKVKWDSVKQKILDNGSNTTPIIFPCKILDENISCAALDGDKPLPHETSAMLLLNVKKKASTSHRDFSFNNFETDRINFVGHCHEEVSLNEKQESNYWIPDGGEISSCNMAIGMNDKRFGMQKIEKDTEVATNYWIPDGAYDSSNAFFDRKSLNIDSLYYASLSDHIVGPSNKDESFRNLFFGLDTLLMNRHPRPIHRFEVERHNSAEHIFQDSPLHGDSSEISSHLSFRNDNCDDENARERYPSNCNTIINCFSTHDYDIQKDVIKYHKLYDVVFGQSIRHQEFEHPVGLGINTREMQHYKKDVLNGNATLHQNSNYHRQSDRDSYYGYWIPDGADFGITKTNNNSTGNVQTFSLKTRNLNLNDNEAISQRQERRDPNFLADLGEESGYWIPDGADFKNVDRNSSETIIIDTSACDKNNEDLFKRLHSIDDNGYSIPIL